MQQPQNGPALLSRRNSIPFGVKIAYTAFVAILVPFYLNFYGPANFLWFCDIALLMTVPALWLENRFLASMHLVSGFLLQIVWLVDFLARLLGGFHLVGMTTYMFTDRIPVHIRLFSLYHAWLPFLLWWIVWRLGYDRRAWIAQTLLAWAVLPICYCCTEPWRNLNAVFGTDGEEPQTWLNPILYLILVMVFYPACIYLPSHLFFRKFGNAR